MVRCQLIEEKMTENEMRFWLLTFRGGIHLSQDLISVVATSCTKIDLELCSVDSAQQYHVADNYPEFGALISDCEENV